MAAPVYDTDLTDITLAETTTDWGAYGGGASGLSASPDLSIQGTNCVDKQITNADKGMYYENATAITLGAGDHVWIWHFCGTPGLTDTLQSKGASVLVGSATNAYCQYHVEGNDTYGASGRVARCYPINYSVRTANTSAPYRTVTGSPGASPLVFGGGLVTTATVKGANVGIDAIRYGTGGFITQGELADPATFVDMSIENDNISNRWGILTKVGGGYELQGSLIIGRTSAGTDTAAYFSDSDVSIAFVDTVHAGSTFNRIQIRHASTEVYWTNVSLTALGTTSPGSVVVGTTNATFEVTGGTWTGLDQCTFRPGSVADGVTFRACDIIGVLGGSASIANCLFENCSGLVACSVLDLEDIDGCHFVGDGTSRAVLVSGTISSNTTWAWNSTAEGYAATNGNNGDEILWVNVAGGVTLTINVAAGATTPSYYNAGTGTVNIVSGQVTTTITVRDIVTGLAIEGARVYLYADTGGPLSQGTAIINKVLTDVNGQASDTRSLASDQPVLGTVRKASSGTLYKPSSIVGAIDNATGLNLTVQMLRDE